MKNILIFRSSNFSVLDKLIEDINLKYNSNYKIHLLAQKEMCFKVKKRYDIDCYIEYPNGFFTYENYNENKIEKNKIESVEYSDIYIPISTTNINSCQEIMKICMNLKFNNMHIFTCDFKYHRFNNLTIRLFFRYAIIKEVIKNICMLAFCKIIYMNVRIYCYIKSGREKL